MPKRPKAFKRSTRPTKTTEESERDVSTPQPPRGSEPEDLFALLEAAGVTHALAEYVVLEGERHGRDQTDELHPLWYPGSRAHAEAVRAFRLKLPPPWKKEDVLGQSRVTHREKGISLVVMAGDARTGIEGDPQPRARHEKGPATGRSVNANERQYKLKHVVAEYRIENRRSDDGIQVWVLLVYRERGLPGQPDVVRYEISLPVRFASKNIRKWAFRKCFPPILLDTPPSMDGNSGAEGSPNDSGGDELPFDFDEIRRRG
jgi:hypothetical protein